MSRLNCSGKTDAVNKFHSLAILYILKFPVKHSPISRWYYTFKRDYGGDNVLKFLECLNNLSWAECYLESDLNIAFNKFHELVCLFYNLCFPKIRIKIDTLKNTKRRWITRGLKISCRTKRKLRYIDYNQKTLYSNNIYKSYSNLLKNA